MRRAHGQHVRHSSVGTSAAAAEQKLQVAGSTARIVARDAKDEKALGCGESTIAQFKFRPRGAPWSGTVPQDGGASIEYGALRCERSAGRYRSYASRSP